MTQPAKTPADALREAVERARRVREAAQTAGQAIKEPAPPIEPGGPTGA